MHLFSPLYQFIKAEPPRVAAALSFVWYALFTLLIGVPPLRDFAIAMLLLPFFAGVPAVLFYFIAKAIREG